MAEMIAGARKWITLPNPPPLTGGVLSVATVIEVTDLHELMGVQAQTDACATVQEWTEDWCDMTPGAPKVFDALFDETTGDPFAVYAGVACDLQRMDESETRARNRLLMAESRSVDHHIDALLATDADVDLGGPFPFEQAVGAAEAFAATVYGGAATLLVPRLFLPCGCANGLLSRNLDGSLTTCGGSRVAPLTTPVAVPVVAETGTMYVTGSIVLFRGPINSFSVPQQVTNDVTGAFSPARALAERIYVPIFDCLTAKVEVSCS